MDNEEIKKLLQELKESSDESTAVRSKIVKIHIDTPAEAERRRRAKKKAEEAEARKKQEEEARAQEEEEARRLEAEKAALEAVEEAKREAKAGFASDLESDIMNGPELTPEQDPGADMSDLDLNWDYEKPSLTSGFAKDEDFDLGQGTGSQEENSSGDAENSGSERDSDFSTDGSKSSRRSGKSDDGKEQGTGADHEDDDFASDEDDFRSGEERESITGLPGLFGAISDRVISFAGGIRKSVKEDLTKVKEGKEGKEESGPEEEKTDEGKADEEKMSSEKPASFSGSGEDDSIAAVADNSKEMQELPSYWDDEPADKEIAQGSVSGSVESSADRKSRKAGGSDSGHGSAGESDTAKPGTSDLHEFPSGGSGSSSARREYGPDEEWKRRMEEPPKRKSFLEKLKSDRVKRGTSGPSKREKEEKKKENKEPKGGSVKRSWLRRGKEQEESQTDESGREEVKAEETRSEGLQEDSLRENTLQDETLRDKDLQSNTLEGSALQDRTLQNNAFRDKDVHDAVLQDSTLTDGDSQDTALQSEYSESVKVQTEETQGEEARGEETQSDKLQETDHASDAEAPEIAAADREKSLGDELQLLLDRGSGAKNGNKAQKDKKDWKFWKKLTKTAKNQNQPKEEAKPASEEAKSASDMPEDAALDELIRQIEGTDVPAQTGDIVGEKPQDDDSLHDPEEKQQESETADQAPSGEKMPQSIEVIDLNENQNNKDAEIIPLVGDTGPLPNPDEVKKQRAGFRMFGGKSKNSGKAKRSGKGKDSGKEKSSEKAKSSGKIKGSEKAAGYGKAAGSGAAGFKGFFAQHKKQCLIGAAAAAVILLLIVIIVIVSNNTANTRRSNIVADEGLTVRILQQPESYSTEGDIGIRVSAPETIQSITVNGENVVIEQGKSVDFTYHAAGGTLDIMAVSTDKVRNSKVVLAYVDSQPPVITIKEEDGKIVLSAEDSESGLAGLYIGTTVGLSEVPQYVEYSEPLEKDPNKEITYYAKDLAGNSTVPTVVALTPAESISFEQEKYELFPGSTAPVTLVTVPEHAFVNNLELEAENDKVVQIEGGTQLKGISEGDTKITATADGIAGVMASVSVAEKRQVTISAVGDCTLGTDSNFSQNNSFDAYASLYGNSYFFEKVKGILSSDDSTFANLEGTFTTSDQRGDKIYAFKGDPSYTQILQEGSIDAVTLANNHCDDFGDAGETDTQKALDEAGIVWCKDNKIAYRDLNGIKTAYIGIYALENGLDTLPQVKSTIAEAKEEGAELIIIEFHWGAELVAEIDEFQKELAHAAVDEGADLVLGSHAHVLQAIEKYNGVYIVYGLANFCFGGNANPTSYDTIIWRQTFTFTADGLESEDDISIIPCQVSGDLTSNNYQPVPVSGDTARSIMQTIDDLSSVFGQSYSQYMVDGTLWTAETGA